MQVYLLTNQINGKYYVGKTVAKNLNSYLSVKRWAAKHGKNQSMPVVRAIAKYGWENFQVDTICTATTLEQLDDLEKLWIILLNARAPEIGYNISAGGNLGRTGVKNTAEHNAKIGLANKGKKPVGYVRTDEHRRQLQDRMRGNLLGTKFTSETGGNYLRAETPEQKAKRHASIKAAWDRRKSLK